MVVTRVDAASQGIDRHIVEDATSRQAMHTSYQDMGRTGYLRRTYASHTHGSWISHGRYIAPMDIFFLHTKYCIKLLSYI